MAPKLSVVIPAYNEATRLPEALSQAQRWLAAQSYSSEVLVVDDGSNDDTVATVERLAAAWKALRLMRNPGNRGKGYSVRHGMLEAAGELVLFSDADFSAPIEETDKLMEAIAGGFDIAIGSRAMRRELIGTHQSALREKGGQVFNLIVRTATGLPFQDTQCGFKLFRRNAAQSVCQRQKIEGFGFDMEILYLARRMGFRIAEVPVRWNHSEGTKFNMVRDTLEMLADLARIRRWDSAGKYDLPEGK